MKIKKGGLNPPFLFESVIVRELLLASASEGKTGTHESEDRQRGRLRNNFSVDLDIIDIELSTGRVRFVLKESEENSEGIALAEGQSIKRTG